MKDKNEEYRKHYEEITELKTEEQDNTEIVDRYKKSLDAMNQLVPEDSDIKELVNEVKAGELSIKHQKNQLINELKEGDLGEQIKLYAGLKEEKKLTFWSKLFKVFK